ncbi:Tn7-like element transposition protein TnsE [Effusibacillus lacus]|uniref:Tn7-like element transposition protein TnsE n=1 Tax=Effusibacillus lacus TaxID=1348429 RepID=UPI000BB82CA2|nr:Tn7-like element transposition protein TnsE [Effusibacillus lacus]TCS68542.1 hypothetical protein EDD64_14225 [Effusibacillus lacus]
MATIKLRPWPFRSGEPIELFWFGSLFQDHQGNWKIPVAFKIKNDIQIVNYPWGTLPLLRLGQQYVDGSIGPFSLKRGMVDSLTLTNSEEGDVCQGFDLPSQLIYFHKIRDLGTQKLRKFRIGKITYYIPCIEIIRSFFAKTRTLAYSLLEPNGLEMLINDFREEDNKAEIDLSRRIPNNMVNENLITHLAWILGNENVRTVWNEIYNHIYQEALAKSPINPVIQFRNGIPIQARLPVSSFSKITYRGLKAQNHVLILEILGIAGLNIPYRRIMYSHSSLKQKVRIQGEKRLKLTQKRMNEDYVLEENSRSAKEDVNQSTVEISPTLLTYDRKPEVSVRFSEQQPINTGNGYVVVSGKGGKYIGTAQKVSTQDSVYGGDTTPIEFGTITTVPIQRGIGLEGFFRVIQYIQKMYPEIKINASVAYLPSGKRFSVCPDGTRRTCAIVQLNISNHVRYLLEIARPDGWSISTLMLIPKPGLGVQIIERYISILLESVVEKGGHWDQDILDKCRDLEIERIRHYKNDTVESWAVRLVGRIV